MPPLQTRAFSLVEVLVLIGIVVILIAVLLPVLAYQRRQTRIAQNTMQLRSIHQGMVVASSGRTKARMMPFPGTDRVTGDIHPDGADTGYSGDGSVPAARFCQMLNGHFFDSPATLISPMDPSKTEARAGADGKYRGLTTEHHSYAALALPGSGNERAEWALTLNPEAVVLGDRAIGTGPADHSSVWTEPGSGDWRGGVAHNDNHTSMIDTHVVANTRYGEGAVNLTDDLFADDPTADDAFLVHEDATTAYSVE